MDIRAQFPQSQQANAIALARRIAATATAEQPTSCPHAGRSWHRRPRIRRGER